ncbi:MAG: helix-turn-helix transcriptional regulator [Aequorivita sp.]|nr:helix-turn-helix transcriptional regulator [Aequorivita sp.]
MEILRIKEVLNEKSMTGKDLAHKVGVTETALSMIINGKRQPRFELLTKIAMVLDVDIRDLFNSTKDNDMETIFVQRGSNYLSIGNITKST